MFDLRNSQKGGERLDTTTLNNSIFRLLSDLNVKPIPIASGHIAFTTPTRTIVTQPESFKIGFLFVNTLELWNNSIGTYPDTPNVDSVTIKDVEGAAIITTLLSTQTGQFVVEKQQGFSSVIGSWRYCEFELSEDYLFMVLEKFGYDSGDAQNGIFTLGYKTGFCQVFQIPIREVDTLYVPFFYNQLAGSNFAQTITEAIYERKTGICTVEKYENLETNLVGDVIVKPFILPSDRQKSLITSSGESFDVWFWTEGKIDIADYLGDGYRFQETFDYGSDKLVHLVLEDDGVEKMLVKDLLWIQGLSIFLDIRGKTYYPDITTEPQNYVTHYPVLLSGIDKPVDSLQVNYAKHLVGCRYNEDWSNFDMSFNGSGFVLGYGFCNQILLKPKKITIQGVANTEIGDYPKNSRGTFLIS